MRDTDNYRLSLIEIHHSTAKRNNVGKDIVWTASKHADAGNAAGKI